MPKKKPAKKAPKRRTAKLWGVWLIKQRRWLRVWSLLDPERPWGDGAASVLVAIRKSDAVRFCVKRNLWNPNSAVVREFTTKETKR